MTDAKTYDVIVIGAGSGLDVASFAAAQGMQVALVEQGPMGGTCLNRGCIPSKMLIHGADVAETIRTSEKFGISASITNIDFGALVRRVSAHVDKEAQEIEDSIRQDERMTLYKTEARFIADKTLQVGDETITADKIIIAGGARPAVPRIDGLETVPYLTSTEALRLETQPKHLTVIGGGYIAAELAHFYSALGTKVTMLVREATLLTKEDSDIAAWFGREFADGIDVRFDTEAKKVARSGAGIAVTLQDGETITTDQLLLATGIQPNTDLLDVQASGIRTTERGYVETNDYFETNVDGVWAFGDIIGKMQLKHVANDQAEPVVKNAFFGKQETVDYHKIPHALFSSPQVAGVGYTEEEVKQQNIPYHVGRYELKNTGMGAALQQNGLVKILVDNNGKILGGHIVGPDASTLIHEIVVAMQGSGSIQNIVDVVYAHPALSEWVQRAFYAVRD